MDIVLRRFLLAAFLLSLLLPAALRAAEPPPPAPVAPLAEEQFEETVTVGLASVRARILDAEGNPFVGLKPEEVQVRIGRRGVPITALDYYDGWVTADDAPDFKTALPADKAKRYSPHQVSARGQMFVFFVEAGARGQVPGDAAMLKRLADSLPRDAYAAVVSLDTRLELQLDLTKDREALYQALVRGRRGEKGPGPPASRTPLSLWRFWNEKLAEEAVHTESSLMLAAAVLDRLPGEKVMVFLGEEPSHFRRPPGKAKVPQPTEEIYQAIRMLQTARVSLFVLDIARAPKAPATQFLYLLAASTGGSYTGARKDQRDAAVDRLMRKTQGYYIVTFDYRQLEETARSAPLTLELTGKQGTVLTSPFRVVSLAK